MTAPLAVITGASVRVGRAIAIELGRCGFDLLLTYRSRRADAERTADLARGESARDLAIELFEVDYDNDASVDAFAATLRARSRIDALIHNASSYAATPLATLRREDALAHYRANALAPLLLSIAARGGLEHSILPGGGAIICFADIHALGRPRRNYAAYAMSKAALAQMVESLAIDLAPGIRVNGIAPGVIAWPEDTDPAERARYESRIPLGRSGTPADAASMVRWLVVEATYVTGEIVRLDGGRWLR